MTYPKMQPCPTCKNEEVALYGYGDAGPLNWHVECDECHYLGPCGNKLQAIKLHNARQQQPGTSHLNDEGKA